MLVASVAHMLLVAGAFVLSLSLRRSAGVLPWYIKSGQYLRLQTGFVRLLNVLGLGVGFLLFVQIFGVGGIYLLCFHVI